MKMIEAIIRPERLEAVMEALAGQEVFRLTVSDVQGCARQRGQALATERSSIAARLQRKIKLEVAVNEEFLEATVNAIANAGRTDQPQAVGEGKIFILPLEDVVRIRTGERGGTAI